MILGRTTRTLKSRKMVGGYTFTSSLSYYIGGKNRGINIQNRGYGGSHESDKAFRVPTLLQTQEMRSRSI